MNNYTNPQLALFGGDVTAVLRSIASSYLFHAVEHNEDGTWSCQHGNTPFAFPNFGEALRGIITMGNAFREDPTVKLG